MVSSRSVIALALFASACLPVQAQTVPALDHISINDGRVFDLSDAGNTYRLDDGPEATATLNLVQGPKGRLTGIVTFQDEALNTFGPVTVNGKLSVKGTTPLAMTLKGNSPAKVQLTGTYEPGLKMMNVRITAKSPDKRTFAWNDSFIPTNASSTGLSYHRMDVLSNQKLAITSNHAVSGPALSALVKTADREGPASSFSLKGKGVNLFGNYNTATTTFTVTSSIADTGYGRITTPGSLVTVTSDNFIVRQP